MSIKIHSAYPVTHMLIVILLTNGLSLAFQAELFAHELDHIRQSLSPNPAAHLASHRENVSRDGGELDAATHLCLHSAGQYQPFYFIFIPLVPSLESKEILVVYSSSTLPESVPDLPYHPPSTNYQQIPISIDTDRIIVIVLFYIKDICSIWNIFQNDCYFLTQFD